MKITLLESQKKDPSRLNIYVDEIFFCGVSLDTVAKYGLYASKEVTDEILQEIIISELQKRFFDRAVSFLLRAPKSKYQISRYLNDLSFKKKGKWFKELQKEDLENIISKVLLKLEEYKYIDDEQFARIFVSSRIKNKPKGKDILTLELQSKGIKKDLAIQIVNELVEDEYSLLVNTFKKKFKEESITFNDRKKIDFLRRKGFNWDLIEKYINNESTK